MEELLKILGIALISALKPIIALPTSVATGAQYFETIAGGILGGCVGIWVYLYSLDYLILTYQKFILIRRQKPGYVEKVTIPKKKFTKRNRMIVRLMSKYGLVGIAAITPLLSLPLGVFIAARINDKFIHNRKKVLLYLCVSMVIWTFVIATVSTLFKGGFK